MCELGGSVVTVVIYGLTQSLPGNQDLFLVTSTPPSDLLRKKAFDRFPADFFLLISKILFEHLLGNHFGLPHHLYSFLLWNTACSSHANFFLFLQLPCFFPGNSFPLHSASFRQVPFAGTLCLPTFSLGATLKILQNLLREPVTSGKKTDQNSLRRPPGTVAGTLRVLKNWLADCIRLQHGSIGL